MSGSMLITVCSLSGYGRVRRITVSVPYIAVLLEPPTRYFLSEAMPAGTDDTAPDPIRRRYRRRHLTKNQTRALAKRFARLRELREAARTERLERHDDLLREQLEAAADP